MSYLDSREATVDRFLAMIKQLEVDRDRLQLEVHRLQEWKNLAYEMRNRSWWAMRNKVLVKFDDMHKKDWQQQ